MIKLRCEFCEKIAGEGKTISDAIESVENNGGGSDSVEGIVVCKECAGDLPLPPRRSPYPPAGLTGEPLNDYMVMKGER